MTENAIQIPPDKNMEDNLKRNFLAAYQTLEFSKINTIILTEIADNDRKCMFTKFTICKNNPNKSILAALCQTKLKKYADLVDGRTALNNYWQQFNLLNLYIDNNPLEWMSNLAEPNIALKFLLKLPCNSEVTLHCKNKYYSNRDIEKMTLLWKNGGVSPRTRKIPQQDIKYIESKDKNKSSEIKAVKTSFSPSKKERDSINRKLSNLEIINTARVNCVLKTDQHLMERSVQYSVENSSVLKEEKQEKKFSGFATARSVLAVHQAKINRQATANRQQSFNNKQHSVKKSLGGRAVNSAFVCPFKDEQPKQEESPPEPSDERLKNIEPKMIELIKNEIMDSGSPITWDDIAGLDNAKQIIKEIVVFPMLRPDIFTGLRRPPKGILLFGPPGTGKTLIGKCIASQSKSTFFSISASSLTSKWIGEGEKMVRALFAVARVEQPSVVFIDEIDSLLCQRSETEHESSRRMKTEFLVQLDGATTGDEDRILVIGATNRPYELDEAARRRLVKRLYIPLPELEARVQIVQNLLKSEQHNLTPENIHEIAKMANGYSGADMTNLCKEASMGPIRSIPFDQLKDIRKEDVRKVTYCDFQEALSTIRPSVSQKDLSVYLDWDRAYGTASVQKLI